MSVSSPGWFAPTAYRPVDATVVLPGSKSLTARWLVLAALAVTPTHIRGALRSRDSDLMVAGLRALGTEVSGTADGYRVEPHPLRGPARVDCGLAGTVLRFLPPVATLAQGPTTFSGDDRAADRPLTPLLQALRTLGASIDGDGLPLTVRGHGSLPGGRTTVDGSASSQLISGLLLSAPRFEQGLELEHSGGEPPSTPHLAMTVECLQRAGAEAEAGERSWRVRPGELRLEEVQVEPDLSNAGPFLAAALVTGGTVRVPHWPQHTTQAGDALRGILAAMGADVVLDDDGLTVSGTGRVLGLDADLHHVGELVPTVVAVAALAETPTRITGVAHLRGHETDRLAALTTELRRLGGDVDELEDGIVVRPRPLRGTMVASYADHRMATAAAVIGLRVPDVAVDDITVTSKTMPDFPQRWTQLLDGRSAIR